jgi:transposase
MAETYGRHDLSDQDRALLEPRLPGQPGQWGGIADDNRRFINAVLCILRTGARRGAICRRPAEAGKTPIAGFAGGAIRVFGNQMFPKGVK